MNTAPTTTTAPARSEISSLLDMNILYTRGMHKWKIALFGLTLAGVSFSGYLSAIKFFTDTCAFNESCPYFIGYPACWYGFAMYLVMFATACLALVGKLAFKKSLNIIRGVSLLGIIFSGSFAIQEVMRSRATGTLGLSTCVYGLLFYLAIWIVALLAFKKIKRAATEA